MKTGILSIAGYVLLNEKGLTSEALAWIIAISFVVGIAVILFL